MKKIKCVVWDLDNTLWRGTLLEDSNVQLNDDVVAIIKTLDARGILNSIASKNNNSQAMAKLEEFNISDYFLYPKVNWGPKSKSIKTIATDLNIGIDTFAFVDDQEFELDEVKFSLPDVLTISASNISDMINYPEFMPRFITDDSSKRRQMYLNDICRNNLEEDFSGSKDEFLDTLAMKLTITSATEGDLQRAEELTLRTSQLNTTGYTYTYEQLNSFISSDIHKLLIVELVDKYGSYGKTGLILLEKNEDAWTMKLFLLSCRVMTRGVGTVLIHYLRRVAKKRNVKLLAEFLPTDRNRMMYMTYKFAGFVENKNSNELIILENDLNKIPDDPRYIELIDQANL